MSTFYTLNRAFDLSKKNTLAFSSILVMKSSPISYHGQHYPEQREDEEISLYATILPTTQQSGQCAITSRPTSVAAVLRWNPATLHDKDLLVEERGHGPLTERVVSALRLVEDSVVWKGIKAAEEAIERRRGVGVGTASGRQAVVEDLERQIKDSEIS